MNKDFILDFVAGGEYIALKKLTKMLFPRCIGSCEQDCGGAVGESEAAVADPGGARNSL